MTSGIVADALKALEPVLWHSRELLDTAQLHKAQRFDLPPPEDPSDWEKIDPLCTDRAKLMLWYFETYGVIGLAYFIVEIAKYEANEESEARQREAFSQPSEASNDNDLGMGMDSSVSDIDMNEDSLSHDIDVGSSRAYNKSWDLILKDGKDNANRTIIYYLSSLPAELIVALIKGNLPSRMQEVSFRRNMETYVRAVDRQGTYGIFIALQRVHAPSTQQDAEVNRYAGHGMTLKQLQEVHKTMCLYIAVEDPSSKALARQIDKIFSGNEKAISRLDYSFQRRYSSGSNNDDFGRQKEWLNFIKVHYLDWAESLKGTADEKLLDIPLQRCPVYVGLSRSVISRMTNHWKHSATINPTIGLLVAVLEFLFPKAFSVTQSSYQIFKTISQSHIGFDEKLSMLLTGSYPWDGGLNADYGGRSKGPKGVSAESLRRMEANKDEIAASGLVNKNIDESLAKIEHVRQTMAKIKEMPALRDKVHKASHENEQRAEQVVKKTEYLQARLRQLQLADAIASYKEARERQQQRRNEQQQGGDE